jgi:hypothetical protein
MWKAFRAAIWPRSTGRRWGSPDVATISLLADGATSLSIGGTPTSRSSTSRAPRGPACCGLGDATGVVGGASSGDTGLGLVVRGSHRTLVVFLRLVHLLWRQSVGSSPFDIWPLCHYNKNRYSLAGKVGAPHFSFVIADGGVRLGLVGAPDSEEYDDEERFSVGDQADLR